MSDLGATPGGSRARGHKSASAYRTISEVSDELEIPQHVLRFWETRFTQVRPLKRGGGRRYYRPEDVRLLQRIQKLLYEEGYTIKGVQKLLREGRIVSTEAGSRKPVTGPLFADAGPAEMTGRSSGDTDTEQPAPVDPVVDYGGQPDTTGLSNTVRSELTDILGELRSLRAMLTDDR